MRFARRRSPVRRLAVLVAAGALALPGCDDAATWQPAAYAPASPAPAPPPLAFAAAPPSYPPYAAYPGAPSYGAPASAVPPRPPPPLRASVGTTVVAYATSQVGHPYCWGGVGPGCFDCSGLTLKAWQQVGVQLPRSADDIPKALPPVAPNDVRPGDIFWWPGHVAIYAGNGLSVEALNAHSGVVLRRAPRPRGIYRPAGA